MRWIALLLVVGCSDADVADSDSTATDSGAGSNTEGMPEYSGGACPALIAGHQTFQSDGLARDVRIELPPDPNGAPVVFAWHWLNGNADQMVDYSGLNAFPADHGAIVVAPESRGLTYEWDTYVGADNPDTVLFDDLLRCLVEQHGVDRDRVYSTGMSAGALWTVSLTHHRSDVLAASAPLSGGATQTTWAPAEPTPMLLTWGGSGDLYGSYSFETGTLDLSDQLAANDQFRAHCVHSSGHTLPPGGVEYVWSFFEAHPKGVDEPWASALPEAMPSWCSLP